MALAWSRWILVGIASSLTFACGPVISADDAGADSEDGTGTATDVSATATDPTTADTGTTATTTSGTTGSTTVSTTGSTTVTTTGDPTSATATTTSATTVSTSSTTDPTGDGLPNGASCNDGIECESGHCFVIDVLGGICGECEVDADCEGGGCSIPNPLANPPTPSFCNQGEYGAGCSSDDVCADGLLCAEVIDIPGILSSSTCGECRDAGDCEGGWSCEPDLAIATLSGVKRCVAPGTLANGQTCDWAAGGDAACASGYCATADVMGVLQLGVCSGCEVDADCGDAMICEPPQIDLMSGPIPGACVPV